MTDTRLIQNLGTCSTFLRTRLGLILMVPVPAMVFRDLSTLTIFLLLEHGEYVKKCFKELIISSLESIIHDLSNGVS